jgi:hypothetical protein
VSFVARVAGAATAVVVDGIAWFRLGLCSADAKRPYDDKELDPAKRMRLTPQLHKNRNSSNSNNNEVTRISEVMPDAATDDATTFRAQLARMQEAFVKGRACEKLNRHVSANKTVRGASGKTYLQFVERLRLSSTTYFPKAIGSFYLLPPGASNVS